MFIYRMVGVELCWDGCGEGGFMGYGWRCRLRVGYSGGGVDVWLGWYCGVDIGF